MKYFSDKQLAERFGVDRSTIWRWIKNGDFPKPVKLSPGCTRWPDDTLKDWEIKMLRGSNARS